MSRSYLATLRGESPELPDILLIPAILVAALAATAAGRAAARFGERAVLVAGLWILLVGTVLLVALQVQTPIIVVGVAVALIAIGGFISAVKPAVGQASCSLGPALFALIGTSLFLRGSCGTRGASWRTPASPRIRRGRRCALRTAVYRVLRAEARPCPGAGAVGGVRSNAELDRAIHDLSLIMAAVPATAIVLALVLLRPKIASAPT